MPTKKATKVEETQLREYELVLVYSPELTDEALDASIETLKQFITGKSGTVGEVVKWGKKKLAYPIKHVMEGHYVLFRVNSSPAFSRELDANIRISENILRHLMVRVDA